MSGPNTSYDPVEVAALDPEAVSEAAAAAIAAAAAASTLDQLKAARAAHQGDKSPLALANRDRRAHPDRCPFQYTYLEGDVHRRPFVYAQGRPPALADPRSYA